MEYDEWLRAVQEVYGAGRALGGKIMVRGQMVDMTPENVEACLGDEPRDMYEHGDSPERYGCHLIAEYGSISDEEL